jgi:hypothetical protein
VIPEGYKESLLIIALPVLEQPCRALAVMCEIVPIALPPHSEFKKIFDLENFTNLSLIYSPESQRA